MSEMLAAPGSGLLVRGEGFTALVVGDGDRAAGTAQELEAGLGPGGEFVVVQHAGPLLSVRASGASLRCSVYRADGSVVVIAPPVAPAVTEFVEAHCVGWDIQHGPDAGELTPIAPDTVRAGRVALLASAPAAAAMPDLDDLDDATRLSTRWRRPAALLELANGERIGVLSELLLGRSPRVRRAELDRIPSLVSVEHESVSRTHARIAVDGERVTLEDLGSANGTRVTDPDGTVRDLVVGAPTALSEGMVVLIGDRIAFRVVRVP